MISRIKNKIASTISLCSLGAGFFESVHVLSWITRLYFNRGHFEGATTLRLRYAGQEFTLTVRNDYEDLLMLHEIFIVRIYDSKGLDGQDVHTIIDIGGNIGMSVIFFALTYPEASVVVLEPQESVFRLLVRNTRQFAHVVCLRVAMSDKTGISELHGFTVKTTGASLVSRHGSDVTEKVETISFVDLCRRFSFNRVDLVKTDAEGAEFDFIPDMVKGGVPVVNIVGEIHFDLSSREVDVKDLFGGKYLVTEVFVPKKRRSVIHAALNHEN